jgi:hypothetical protein
MNFESMEPAMQWIFGNIILIWICNICVLFYASCNEPIMKDQYARIQRLEIQNRAIGETLAKLNALLARPVRHDEILDLRYEIALLKTELQKHKSKNVNRRRIIESDDENQ